MSPGHLHKNWRTVRTSSKIARQACIALAGGSVCKKTVKHVKHVIGFCRRTRSKAWASEAADENLDRIDTVFLIDFTILSLPCKPPKACAWSRKRPVVASTESQFWSLMASGCCVNETPVFSSYACKAGSKRACKREDSGRWAISQVGNKRNLWERDWLIAMK
jgi:hypothetical protein